MVEENKPDGKGADETDPYASVPFFKRLFGGQWNACIGKQGHEENYVDGYIEAAIELAGAIFEKQLIGKRDTLALPILYNARHAIELALKFSAKHLIKASLIKDDGRELSHTWAFPVSQDRLVRSGPISLLAGAGRTRMKSETCCASLQEHPGTPAIVTAPM